MVSIPLSLRSATSAERSAGCSYAGRRSPGNAYASGSARPAALKVGHAIPLRCRVPQGGTSLCGVTVTEQSTELSHPLHVRSQESYRHGAHPPTALAAVTSAAEKQGAGSLLRIVLVVMLIGVALTAWFLLRGYKRGD